METHGRIICRLCLKICDNFKAIEGHIKDVLGAILPKINLAAIEEPVICSNCIKLLIKCFDFRAACFYTQENVVPFVNYNGAAKVNLKDVYLSKNEYCTTVPDDQDICGLCMSPVKNCSAISLDVAERNVILENMIKQCLRGLDLSMIKKPVICTSCHGSLEHCFRFVMSCLIVEEKIKKYYESLDINSRDQIKLNDVILFTIRDITTRDVDLADIIKVEQLCEDKKIIDEKEISNKDTVKLEEIFLDDSGDANKDVESKKSFLEMNYQQFIQKNMLSPAKENKQLVSIKREGMFYEGNDTKFHEDDPVDLKDQKFLFDEAIEIKADDHDFNRCEDGIVFPQSEVTKMLQDPLEVTMYKCDSCLYQTKRKDNLKTHLLIHKDPSEITMYKCDSCLYQTKFKYNLKNHLLNHKDPSEITMYKCDFCQYQTKRKVNLKNHLVIHQDPSEVTVYKCDSCLYRTKCKGKIKTHSLKHKDPSEITMYKCDSCSFQTKIKYCLTSHIKLHTDPSELTMYKCESCSFQTKYKSGLRNHLLTHKDPSEITMYKCDSCSFQTKNKFCLRRHLLMHKARSEVTMFRCESCSFQTKHKHSLRNHLLIHKDPSEVTMYKCDSCLYQTKYKVNLKYHSRKHKDPLEVTIVTGIPV